MRQPHIRCNYYEAQIPACVKRGAGDGEQGREFTDVKGNLPYLASRERASIDSTRVYLRLFVYAIGLRCDLTRHSC